MEFGQFELQVFVSLVVVLGAAFVALICDFLKRSNEQLRELATELKVRNEEEQRRSQRMIPRSMAEPTHQRTRPSYIEQRSSLPVARANPAVNAARRAEHPVESNPAPSAELVVALQPAARPASEPMVAVTLVEKPAAAVTKAVAEPAATSPAGKKDWGLLLSRSNRTANKSSRTPGRPLVLQKTLVDAARTSAFPAGFHDGDVLSRLVQSRQPVSGLVVSIGVNTTREPGSSLPDAVVNLVRSLIHPNEFACRSSDEEFLLICLAERGVSAQRRLSQIAEQLWDFQLRSLGQLAIQFSWGGVEVRSESIDEAIASAYERMQETRRARKLLTMALRQAV